MAENSQETGKFWDKFWNLERLDMPLRWKRPRIIVFAGDPYHPDVPDEIIDKAHAVITLCPQHTFIDLTKRWERRKEYLFANRPMCLHESPPGSYAKMAGPNHPLPNVWQGVSVSTQAELDAAMPHLLTTPAAVRVLSLEPLLERMDIESCLGHPCTYCRDIETLDLPASVCPYCAGTKQAFGYSNGRMLSATVGWVIVGCETGPNARPCNREWIESIVAQCQAAGVPVWVKGVNVGDRGRVSHDMTKWPESIQYRELPEKENGCE